MAPSLELIVTSMQVLKVPSAQITFGSMAIDVEKQAFADRLNEVLDDLKAPPKGKGRQEAAAQMFGVGQKGARKWLEGEGFPEMEKCIAIAKRGNVHFEWLMTGRGPKRLDQSQLRLWFEDTPPEMQQEVIDFMQFKGTKFFTGEKLTRYLKWVDSISPLGGKESDGSSKKS